MPRLGEGPPWLNALVPRTFDEEKTPDCDSGWGGSCCHNIMMPATTSAVAPSPTMSKENDGIGQVYQFDAFVEYAQAQDVFASGEVDLDRFNMDPILSWYGSVRMRRVDDAS
jgi:hypothetical protein